MAAHDSRREAQAPPPPHYQPPPGGSAASRGEFSDYEKMSKAELIAELREVRDPEREQFLQILHELHTYQEETRIQTEQLIEAQRELEHSRDRYVSLYESAPVAYFTLDQNGLILDVNLTGATLIGCDRALLINSPFFRHVVSEDRHVWQAYLSFWSKPQLSPTVELRLLARERTIPVQISTRRVLQHEQPVFRLAIFDLTQQKQAEDEVRRLNTELERRVMERTEALEAANEELRAADRRKNEFLAMLGHELRNPLAGISNGLELIKRGDLPPAEFSQATQVMERQLNLMVSLLNDLLDAARVTQGKIKLRRADHDLNEIARAAVAACRPILQGRRHEIVVQLAEEPLAVRCDSARMEQVLVNLLNNAAKYTEPGGRIQLLASREGEHARIDVIDSGIGMSPETLANAFELFSQASTAVDRSQGGLGIGLTLVKSLIELHGGSVEAQSDGPGRGSRFRIRVPLAIGAAVAPSVGEQQPLAGEVQVRMRIAVIEDNRDAAELLKLLLTRWGHEVEVAYNGDAGFELIRQSRPEMALVDIGLPGLDGYQIARRIRRLPGREPIYLVAMTGYGDEATRQQAAEAGFDRHLTKPVSADELSRVFQRVLVWRCGERA